MNIKHLNEDLQELILAFQLNEMAIYYGNDHGTVDNVIEGFKQLSNTKEGMYHIKQTLKVKKQVTQEEINKGLFKPIQKGIQVTREYPVVLVYGEKDKRKGNKLLQGHGVSHIIQGHLNELRDVLPKLNSSLQKGENAYPDKFNNFGIKVGSFRFIFTLVNKEDGTPDHAVLITAFKK